MLKALVKLRLGKQQDIKTHNNNSYYIAWMKTRIFLKKCFLINDRLIGDSSLSLFACTVYYIYMFEFGRPLYILYGIGDIEGDAA